MVIIYQKRILDVPHQFVVQQQEQPNIGHINSTCFIKAISTIKASESASSGLDASPDEYNANNYCSPVSTGAISLASEQP